MKLKKAFGLMLGFALIFGMIVPDTLMVSADEVMTEEGVSIEAESENVPSSEEAMSQEVTSEEAISEEVTSEEITSEEGNGEELSSEGGDVSESPACDCGMTDGTHAEGCPLYEAPESAEETESPTETENPETEESTAEETAECTCGAKEGNQAKA